MSTYSPSLRIELINTGDQAGTWGVTTNSNLGTLIESAIAGYTSVSITSANQALTALNGVADESRNQTIALTTTTTANFNVYAPPAEKTYTIYNASLYTATIYNSTVLGNTTAAGTGVAVPAGKTMTIWSDGTNFAVQNNHLSSVTLGTPLAVADGGTGASTASGARTSLGLGTIATQNANAVAITGGSITGITDLAVADGGTGASTAADARTNLGVPSTSGSGATGTWAIDISGNAATATSATSATTASTATALATGRTIGMTGDVAWTSATFNGTANVTGTSTLATTGVTAGSYTAANITVDAKGRVTAASSGTVARGGVTTVTLTSAAPNATLTSATNKYVFIQNDTTRPNGPSITLPDMTTLTDGAEYFVFANTTPYIVALKSSDGTIREFIQPGASYGLNIKSTGTATGQWDIAFPANVIAADKYNYQTLFTNYAVNGGTLLQATARAIVSLNATTFAFVWGEWTGGTSYFIYAQPFTINTTTKVITAGSRITVATLSSTFSYISNIAYDTDNAGRALVVCVGDYNGTNSRAVYFGLSYSGSTLAASTVTTLTGSNGSACGFAGGRIGYVGYLGSNSAYAFTLAVGGDTGSPTWYVRGCTVTGTTTCTVTDSASNTTVAGMPVGDTVLGARTGLTTFVGSANGGAIARVMSYTPASNIFSIATRSVAATLAIEQGSVAASSSFADGGFMFSNGKAFFGGTVYDITNAGAAGVTTTVSTSMNYKYNYAAGYGNPFNFTLVGTADRSSIYLSGTSMIAADFTSRFECDPSVSAMNLQQSTGIFTSPTPTGSVTVTTLLSSSLVIYAALGSPPSAYPYLYVTVGDVGTPISL